MEDLMVVCGGQDTVGPIDDVVLLDLPTLTWSKLLDGRDASPLRPVSMCCHTVVPCLSSVTWKMFSFGGRTGPLQFDRTVSLLETESMSWSRPRFSDPEVPAGPPPMEHAAAVWDERLNRILLFGGWSNAWLDTVWSLDVAQVVGPKHCVTGCTPAAGQLSGGVELTITGIGFAAPCQVMFSAQGKASGQVVVDAERVDSRTLRCVSPNFERFGSAKVRVRVGCGASMFSTSMVYFSYYPDTSASACIAFGPALENASISRCFPTCFLILAKDGTGKRRFNADLRHVNNG